jgi:hypothetical protein
MNAEHESTIGRALAKIVGKRPDNGFGEPFLTVFGRFTRNREESGAAAYTCSLFLSVIFEGFPSEKLHTFTHYANEHYSRISFDCSKYEELFTMIPDEALDAVTLVDKNCNPCKRKCCKQDIFEAFDFYTNR